MWGVMKLDGYCVLFLCMCVCGILKHVLAIFGTILDVNIIRPRQLTYTLLGQRQERLTEAQSILEEGNVHEQRRRTEVWAEREKTEYVNLIGEITGFYLHSHENNTFQPNEHQ